MDAPQLFQLLRERLLDDAQQGRLGETLRDFAVSGGQQAIAMDVLDRLRAEAESEEQEDRILDLMDVVSGWTSPPNRIWPD